MILAVTGHRPPKVGGYQTPNVVYDAVMRAMDECLIALQPECVITGMALGVDQWMAELCLLNQIPFIAAIPFDGFESRWPGESQEKYRRLLRQAHECHVVTPGAPYDHRLMQHRNIWMVQRCDKLLAIYNGTSGGTANCLRAARNYNKEVLVANLSPEIWRIAGIIEADLEGGKAARNRLTQDQHTENLQRLAEEGRRSRRRRSREAEEAAQLELRPGARRVEEAILIENPVPTQVTQDIARMREELNERILAAAKVPTEMLDRDRAERVVVEKAQDDAEASKFMPKRLIEVGDD
jgi:uncharacterized phage-like protein YoqJ